MKYLIVSADDFGIAKSVNEGVAMACREGIVTSAKIFPSGGAFSDAVRLAGELGLKEAGAHLSLTDAVPVAPLQEVPTLVGRDGRFYKNRMRFIPRFLLGMIDLDQVYVELKAQMEKAFSSGLRITDLSSHEHIHMIPEIFAVFVKLAKEYDVGAIRYPRDDSSGMPPDIKRVCKKAILRYFSKGMAATLRASSIKSPEHFRGFIDSGNITEDVLLGVIDSLPDGVTELVSHPGFLSPEVLDSHPFHKNCEAELFALTSRRVKKRIQDRGVMLMTFGEFLSKR